jgi:hypothetical protein
MEKLTERIAVYARRRAQRVIMEHLGGDIRHWQQREVRVYARRF